MSFFVVAHLPERGRMSADLLSYLIQRKIVFSVSTEIEEVKKTFGSKAVEMVEQKGKLESKTKAKPELITLDDSPVSNEPRIIASEQVRVEPLVPPVVQSTDKQLPVARIEAPEKERQQTWPTTPEAFEPASAVVEPTLWTPPRTNTFESHSPEANDLHAQLCSIFLPQADERPRAQVRSTIPTGNWLWGGAVQNSASEIEVETSSSQSCPSSDVPVKKLPRFDDQNAPVDYSEAPIPSTDNHQNTMNHYTKCQTCRTHFPVIHSLSGQPSARAESHCGACKLAFFRSPGFAKKAPVRVPRKNPRKPKNTDGQPKKPKTTDGQQKKIGRPRKNKAPAPDPSVQELLPPPSLPEQHDGSPSLDEAPLHNAPLFPDGPPFSDDFIQL